MPSLYLVSCSRRLTSSTFCRNAASKRARSLTPTPPFSPCLVSFSEAAGNPVHKRLACACVREDSIISVAAGVLPSPDALHCVGGAHRCSSGRTLFVLPLPVPPASTRAFWPTTETYMQERHAHERARACPAHSTRARHIALIALSRPLHTCSASSAVSRAASSSSSLISPTSWSQRAARADGLSDDDCTNSSRNCSRSETVHI